MYHTTIPAAVVNENDLRDLVQRLASLTGKQAAIDTQFVISTEDANLSSMLDSLADTISNNQPVATRVPAKKERKAREPKAQKFRKKNSEATVKAEPTRGPHVRSIEIKSTGEKISRYMLNQLLKEHRIEPGAELHSPKYGKIVVRNGGPEGEPYRVVNEDEVEV